MRTHWNVAPRYTPGSPASVDLATAERVAAQERDGYAMALDGALGPKDKAMAQEWGLAGIVEQVTERAGKFHVLDLITEDRYVRPQSMLSIHAEELVALAQQPAPKPRRHYDDAALTAGRLLARRGAYPYASSPDTVAKNSAALDDALRDAEGRANVTKNDDDRQVARWLRFAKWNAR